MRTKLPLAVPLAALFWTGCISRYYWGANLHSDGGALVRPVPRRLDRELHDFSQSCVEHLIKTDVEGLKQLAGSELRQKLDHDDLLTYLQNTKNNYAFNDKYDQINSTGGGLWLDETISKDPYPLYDFFITEYKLHGTVEAHAFLVIKKETDGFSLLGFDIHPATHKAEKSDIVYMPSGLRGWKSFR